MVATTSVRSGAGLVASVLEVVLVLGLVLWLRTLAETRPSQSCAGTLADSESSSGKDTLARPTAALLDLDAAPVGLLLQERLLANSRAVWLERSAIEAIQREQQLQSLFGAAAVDERVKIGRLLKADLLILLATSAKPKGISIVVCETNYGLRLAARTIPADDKPEPTVAVLEALINRAIERHREKIAEIVAVSPFVSRDLSYEYNHLQNAYAELVEQALGDRPNLLMVELAEARAIARELGTAGTEATLRRPLPIYLLGEFRHEGQGDKTRVTVRLQALRGEEKLAQREAALRPGEAPAFLQQAARELVAAGRESPRKLPDPREEARRLTQRAVEFHRLEEWEKSLALLEAALLLEPSEQRHYRAVVASSHLTLYYGYFIHPNADDKKLGRQYYLRGLEHLEAFLCTAGNLDIGALDGPRQYVLGYPTDAFGRYLKDPSQADAVAAVEKEREILFRMLRKRVRDGYHDEGWILRALGRDLSEKEYFDLVYRLLVEFKDLPGLYERMESYAMGKYVFDGYNCPEGEAFIAKLERSDNPVFRGGGAWLRWRKALDKPRKPAVPTAAGPRPIPDSQAAQFTPIRFPVIRGAGKGRTISGFLGFTPAGPRMDIAWDRNHVYAIQGKEGLNELWSTFNVEALVQSVAFDGHYVWVAVFRRGGPPWLFVIDPQQETVREVTEDDGLPLQASKNVPQSVRQQLMVAPVSPGRACVAGSFGRSWIALATYDPKAAKAVSVEVFHEARHAWDGSAGFALDPAAAFGLNGMVLLTDKPVTDPAARRRVLIGRSDGNLSGLREHPLLVDPESRKVSVVSPATRVRLFADSPWQMRTFRADQNALYFFNVEQQSPMRLHLYRIGFPEMKPVVFRRDMPEGCLVAAADGLHIVGRKWWRLRADGRLDDMGMVPWDFANRYPGNSLWVRAERDAPKEQRPCLCEICRSRYYGFLAVTESGDRSLQNDRWTTYQVSFREEKVVPAAPIPGEASRRKTDADKAIAECSESIRQDPQDAEAYNRRALAYWRDHQIAKGIADATEAVCLAPQSGKVRGTLGVLHLESGDRDLAISDFTEAIRLDPLDASFHNNRGVARFGKGDLDGAMADLSEAVRIQPQYAEAYFDRGVVWKKRESWTTRSPISRRPFGITRSTRKPTLAGPGPTNAKAISSVRGWTGPRTCSWRLWSMPGRVTSPMPRRV